LHLRGGKLREKEGKEWKGEERGREKKGKGIAYTA